MITQSMYTIIPSIFRNIYFTIFGPMDPKLQGGTFWATPLLKLFRRPWDMARLCFGINTTMLVFCFAGVQIYNSVIISLWLCRWFVRTFWAILNFEHFLTNRVHIYGMQNQRPCNYIITPHCYERTIGDLIEYLLVNTFKWMIIFVILYYFWVFINMNNLLILADQWFTCYSSDTN